MHFHRIQRRMRYRYHDSRYGTLERELDLTVDDLVLSGVYNLARWRSIVSQISYSICMRSHDLSWDWQQPHWRWITPFRCWWSGRTQINHQQQKVVVHWTWWVSWIYNGEDLTRPPLTKLYAVGGGEREKDAAVSVQA